MMGEPLEDAARDWHDGGRVLLERLEAMRVERDAALARAEAAEAALRALVAGHIKCCGEWTTGSGAHRQHKRCCWNVATWESEPFWYCDEHVPKHEVELGIAARAEWADAIRAAVALLNHKRDG
jgi:hypothetical protein